MDLRIAQRMRSLSRTKILLLVLIASVLLTIGIEVAYAQKYQAQVQVSEKPGVGVNPTTEMLDFGDMGTGTAQTRFLSLHNDDGRSAYVVVWMLGSISELTDIGDSAFVLKAGESKRVSIELAVPQSAPQNRYEGTVLVFRLPWFGR